MSVPTIELHGTRLHVEDTDGELPVAVFLHGFLFDGRMFAAQVEALRGDFRCITVDFPAQGRSGRSSVGYSTDQLTGLIIDLLDQLDLGPVHLVGLSMGGFTSMRIAVRRPDLVRSVALLNTSAGPHARSKFPRQLALAAVTLVAGTSVAPITAGIEKEMFGRRFREDPSTEPARAAWRARWGQADRIPVVRTLLGVMGRPDFRGELGRITCAALVVAGEMDYSLPPVQSHEIHEGIPGSVLRVLPGVGHSSPIEDPAAVSDALRAFWSRIAEPA